MPDGSLASLVLSIVSGAVVGAAVVGLRSLVNRGDKVARIDREGTQSATTLNDLESHLRSLKAEMYTRELASRDQEALHDRLDEVRRRVAALEERVHGFSLNGGGGARPKPASSE